MTLHYFSCNHCGTMSTREIFEKAVVLHGPICNCGHAMKEVQPRQTEIGLFTKTGNFKREVIRK